MSEFSVWQAAYAAALAVVERGLALADREAFDDLITLWPQVASRLAQLPPVDWTVLAELEQRQLAGTMRALQSSLDRLSETGTRWQGQLASMLKSLHNSHRLQQTYLR